MTFADLKVEDGLLAPREAYLTPVESRGKPQRLDYILYYNNPLVRVVNAQVVTGFTPRGPTGQFSSHYGNGVEFEVLSEE